MTKPAVLYISYDGMLEPLGQSQVIAYLEQLSNDALLHIVSYEKPADLADKNKRAQIAERLERAGIVWHPLTYHKTPTLPATLYDIAQGLCFSIWLAVRYNVRIVHARSYVPALIGWIVKLLTGARLLFDIRGFWADERVDGGLWPADGLIYRMVKRLEKTLMLGADHIVTLTHASQLLIEDFPYLRGQSHAPISVIPTCADLDRFAPGDRRQQSAFTLGYLGSVGTWYMFDEVLECYRLIREHKPDARLLVINRNDHVLIYEKLSEHGIDLALVELKAVDHADVPAAIRRMDVGAAIIRPVYSKISSAPTKLAEYLGCGIPCLGNVGVGDMQEVLEGHKVGVALTDFSEADRRRAISRLMGMVDDPGLSQRCRDTALALFSLEKGSSDYREIYHQLLRPDRLSS